MQNFSKESLNITEEKLNKLSSYFWKFSADVKLIFERLKLIFRENTSIFNEKYVLSWAGKREAFTPYNTLQQKPCIQYRKNLSN
jgi:hypothetical protein